jgi:hypothetical protein
MSRTRRYIVALKPNGRPSADIREQAERIPDITVLSHSPRQMHVEATPEAASELRAAISEHYRVEEATARKPI